MAEDLKEVKIDSPRMSRKELLDVEKEILQIRKDLASEGLPVTMDSDRFLVVHGAIRLDKNKSALSGKEWYDKIMVNHDAYKKYSKAYSDYLSKIVAPRETAKKREAEHHEKLLAESNTA